jgi:hypothetical protein
VGRRRDTAWEAGLFALSGLSLIVVPVLGAGFDYRYVLPALCLLPAAGVFGGALLRERLRRLATAPAHPLQLSVAAALVVLLGTNLTQLAVTPTARQQPRHPLAMGTQVRLHDGLWVRASSLRALRNKCVLTPERTHVSMWEAEVYLRVHDRGASRLVQIPNLQWRTGALPPVQATSHFVRHRLIDVVLSNWHPNTAGWVGLLLSAEHGVLEYTDPTGAGTAGWTFSVSAPQLAPLGSPCTLPPPAA